MKIKIIKDAFLTRKSISTLIMRTIILFLSLALFSFTPLELLSQNVKIVIKNNQKATVDQVFEIIKKQTKYRFVYRSDMFDNLPKIELEKGEISVNTLLEKSLSRGNFKYEVAGNNTIIIKDIILLIRVENTIENWQLASIVILLRMSIVSLLRAFNRKVFVLDIGF